MKSGDERILTPDSRFMFRTCLPAAPMVATPIVEYAQKNGLTKIGAIIADYPWGHAFESAIQAAVAESPGIELHLETAPVPEQDFTTYLREIQAFGPDLLVAPVWKVGQRQRTVYLPTGTWRSYWEPTQVWKGRRTITVDVPLDAIPVFVRDGAVVPGP